MTKTYKAVLKGNQLDWIADAPESDQNHPVKVEVIVEEKPKVKKNVSNNMSILECLEDLAASNAFAEIDDPVEWQREIRKDRPLPFRD